MPRKKYTEGQIALVVKELENGAKVEDLCRKLGVSEATVYNWRKKYAGMSAPEVRRLKQLEEANTRLKRVVADLTLDKVILRLVLTEGADHRYASYTRG
jgi:putative transposase